jgi:hypothetical protein
MKPAAAREGKDVGANLAADINDALPRFLKARVVEHNQDTARSNCGTPLRPAKPPGDPAICEGSVIRPVVSEFPPKKLLEELPGCGQIGRLKFDVINLVVRTHK